jgi:hypothetical protein
MVQAILNTKPGVWPAEPVDPEKPYKWQTRRVIKRPVNFTPLSKLIVSDRRLKEILRGPGGTLTELTRCEVPYTIGDILWVRETWRCAGVGSTGDSNVACIEYKCGEGKTIDINKEQARFYASKARFKPSIHMPREAARLFLEVKNVLIERIQNISERDVVREGITILSFVRPDEKTKLKFRGGTFITGFKHHWDSLNAKRGYSWDNNPWVWVIEFMRTEGYSRV